MLGKHEKKHGVHVTALRTGWCACMPCLLKLIRALAYTLTPKTETGLDIANFSSPTHPPTRAHTRTTATAKDYTLNKRLKPHTAPPAAHHRHPTHRPAVPPLCACLLPATHTEQETDKKRQVVRERQTRARGAGHLPTHRAMCLHPLAWA
jgi:hypothetical protein